LSRSTRWTWATQRKRAGTRKVGLSQRPARNHASAEGTRLSGLRRGRPLDGLWDGQLSEGVAEEARELDGVDLRRHRGVGRCHPGTSRGLGTSPLPKVDTVAVLHRSDTLADQGTDKQPVALMQRARGSTLVSAPHRCMPWRPLVLTATRKPHADDVDAPSATARVLPRSASASLAGDGALARKTLGLRALDHPGTGTDR